MDETNGDLYEAEELYRDGHRINCSTLLLIHYPKGTVYEPAERLPGRYFGEPVYLDSQIYFVMADFPEDKISIMRFSPVEKKTSAVTELARSSFQDCYNLRLHGSPLILTRHAHENRFEILWPEPLSIAVGTTETFLFWEDGRLYFNRWQEDPDYREEVIVRSSAGEILECFPGDIWIMPNGEKWHID